METVHKERNFEGITVAFEAPKGLVEHRDARLTYTKYNGENVVGFVYLKGCRTCQNVISKCDCASPIVSEVWAYDREVGINQDLLDRLNKLDEERRLQEQDIFSLLANLEGCFEEQAGIRRTLNIFKPVDPRLLAHLDKCRGKVRITFSYPQSWLNRVQKVWDKFGRKLEIRPIANMLTDRYGPSARIQFPRPQNITVLASHPGAMKSANKKGEQGEPNPTVVFHDVRLALQLYFDYDYSLRGSKWKEV